MRNRAIRAVLLAPAVLLTFARPDFAAAQTAQQDPSSQVATIQTPLVIAPSEGEVPNSFLTGIMLDATPGATSQHRMLLTNTSADLTLDVSFVAVAASMGDNGQPEFSSVQNGATGAGRWFTFFPSAGRLAPGETREIVFDIEVPAVEPAGPQMAGVAVNITNATTSSGTSVPGFVRTIYAPVEMNVLGVPAPALKVRGARPVERDGQKYIEVFFRNSGLAEATGTGQLTVKDYGISASFQLDPVAAKSDSSQLIVWEPGREVDGKFSVGVVITYGNNASASWSGRIANGDGLPIDPPDGVNGVNTLIREKDQVLNEAGTDTVAGFDDSSSDSSGPGFREVMIGLALLVAVLFTGREMLSMSRRGQGPLAPLARKSGGDMVSSGPRRRAPARGRGRPAHRDGRPMPAQSRRPSPDVERVVDSINSLALELRGVVTMVAGAATGGTLAPPNALQNAPQQSPQHSTYQGPQQPVGAGPAAYAGPAAFASAMSAPTQAALAGAAQTSTQTAAEPPAMHAVPTEAAPSTPPLSPIAAAPAPAPASDPIPAPVTVVSKFAYDHDKVKSARSKGHSWDNIAAALQTTPGAVMSRFASEESGLRAAPLPIVADTPVAPVVQAAPVAPVAPVIEAAPLAPIAAPVAPVIEAAPLAPIAAPVAPAAVVAPVASPDRVVAHPPVAPTAPIARPVRDRNVAPPIQPAAQAPVATPAPIGAPIEPTRVVRQQPVADAPPAIVDPIATPVAAEPVPPKAPLEEVVAPAVQVPEVRAVPTSVPELPDTVTDRPPWFDDLAATIRDEITDAFLEDELDAMDPGTPSPFLNPEAPQARRRRRLTVIDPDGVARPPKGSGRRAV